MLPSDCRGTITATVSYWTQAPRADIERFARAPTHTASALTAADPLTGLVRRDGGSIELTPKERAVLEALLSASPGGLTAEKLLEQAWDENADPFTTTVKATIGRLRRKLGHPDIIKTTPGVGYRIATAESDAGSGAGNRPDGPNDTR